MSDIELCFRINRHWMVVVLVILLTLLITPNAFSESRCAPLLLMIQGGGWSSSSQGHSIRELAEALEFNYNDQGIKVTAVDHSPYMSRNKLGLKVLIEGEQASIAAKRLRDSGYWPVVIVGHSLGAATAFGIAQQFPISLLVTLDGVEQDHPHPPLNNATFWINVWISTNSGYKWLGPYLGLDWEHEPHANVNINLEGVAHTDVNAMYYSDERIKRNVLKALTTCPVGVRANPKPQILCDLPGVKCPIAGGYLPGGVCEKMLKELRRYGNRHLYGNCIEP